MLGWKRVESRDRVHWEARATTPNPLPRASDAHYGRRMLTTGRLLTKLAALVLVPVFVLSLGLGHSGSRDSKQAGNTSFWLG